jgi:voltage-gated potassium channel
VFEIGDLRVVRALRLLRIERVFTMGRYAKSLIHMNRAIRRKKDELVVSFVIILVILVIASSMTYFLEHDAQPEKFSSIPESLWWGAVTLTSVGYGDIYPVTPLGKVFGGLIALLGIALVAMPSGIIVTGFLEEVTRKREEEEGSYCPHCGKRIR